jgi:hypothetical protein
VFYATDARIPQNINAMRGLLVQSARDERLPIDVIALPRCWPRRMAGRRLRGAGPLAVDDVGLGFLYAIAAMKAR